MKEFARGKKIMMVSDIDHEGDIEFEIRWYDEDINFYLTIDDAKELISHLMQEINRVEGNR